MEDDNVMLRGAVTASDPIARGTSITPANETFADTISATVGKPVKFYTKPFNSLTSEDLEKGRIVITEKGILLNGWLVAQPNDDAISPTEIQSQLEQLQTTTTQLQTTTTGLTNRAQNIESQMNSQANQLNALLLQDGYPGTLFIKRRGTAIIDREGRDYFYGDKIEIVDTNNASGHINVTNTTANPRQNWGNLGGYGSIIYHNLSDFALKINEYNTINDWWIKDVPDPNINGSYTHINNMYLFIPTVAWTSSNDTNGEHSTKLEGKFIDLNFALNNRDETDNSGYYKLTQQDITDIRNAVTNYSYHPYTGIDLPQVRLISLPQNWMRDDIEQTSNFAELACRDFSLGVTLSGQDVVDKVME